MHIERFKQRLLDKERELRSDITRLESEARVSGEGEVRDLRMTPPPPRAHLNPFKKIAWRRRRWSGDEDAVQEIARPVTKVGVFWMVADDFYASRNAKWRLRFRLPLGRTGFLVRSGFIVR